MQDGLKEVVRDNVIRLLGMQPGDRGLLAALMKKGFGNGTAQAVIGATRQFRLATLQRLAKAFHIELWQLLVPDLDPNDMPRAERPEFRWPFRKIDPNVVLGLTGTAAQQVENGLLVSLATLGISPKKQQSTGT